MNLFGPPNVEKLRARGDIARLVALLDPPKDRGTSWKAMEALGTLGLTAVGPLRDTVAKHPNMRVKKLACLALGAIGDPGVAANLAFILTHLKPAYVPLQAGRREFDDDDLGRVTVDLEQILARQLARFGDPSCLPNLRRHPEWGLAALLPALEARAAALEAEKRRRHQEQRLASALDANLETIREFIAEGLAAPTVTEIVRRIAEINDRNSAAGRSRARSMALAPAASSDFIPATSHADRDSTNRRLKLEAALGYFGPAARAPLTAIIDSTESSASMRSVAQWHLGTLRD